VTVSDSETFINGPYRYTFALLFRKYIMFSVERIWRYTFGFGSNKIFKLCWRPDSQNSWNKNELLVLYNKRQVLVIWKFIQIVDIIVILLSSLISYNKL